MHDPRAEVPRRVTDSKLVEMMSGARAMVRTAIKAFVERDLPTAEDVRSRDDRIDSLYHEVLREIVAQMTEDPQTIFEATRLQSTAKYIERIGDHATNVAEMIYYEVTGEEIVGDRPRFTGPEGGEPEGTAA